MRLADRHPADEARLLAMGLKKIFHQPYGSPADAAAYAKYMADIRALPPRYLAEIAAKTFFRPLSTSSLCFVKYTDWHWVGDDAEVQDLIKAVRTARMAAEEGKLQLLLCCHQASLAARQACFESIKGHRGISAGS